MNSGPPGGLVWQVHASAARDQAAAAERGASVVVHVLGPDFLALQVGDLDRSASFYCNELGLRRATGAPPGVVAFETATIPFAVREPLPGTDLDAGPAGLGVSVSLRVDDARALHDRLQAGGVPILMEPFDTPFGLTFVFRDPDGYAVAVHGALPASPAAGS